MKYRVIVFRDRDWWIAQVLERDFAAQGKTIKKCLESIRDMIAVMEWTYEQEPDTEQVKAAPSYFEEWYNNATDNYRVDSIKPIRVEYSDVWFNLAERATVRVRI